METAAVSPRKSNKRLFRKLRSYLTSYLFLVPSFAFLLLFMYYPIFIALIHSFTDWDLATSEWTGLENFKRIFTNQVIYVSSINQIIFTFTDVLKALIFPLIAAELIYVLKGKRSKYIFRTGFILPMLVPTIVTFLLWSNIYNPSYGLLNQFLTFLNLEQWNHAWTGDSRTAMWSVIFMSFPFVSGLPFLLYYSAIGNISTDLTEAARIDGATGWKVFWKIHVPLLYPMFKIISILTIIGSLQDIVKIIVLTNGGPGTATIIPALNMYNAAFMSSEYGYASAIGTCLFFVIGVLTVINLKFFKTDY